MVAGFAFLAAYYPPGVDWVETFSQVWRQWRDPYAIPTFANPPWIFALLPHAILPLAWGNAINFGLNVAALVAISRRYGGDGLTLALVFTSPPFFDLARTNNVEWIPMLALLLPPSFGLPLLVLKPHTLGGIVLIWWKRATNRLLLLLPLAAVVALSFVIWGFWPGRMWSPQQTMWNFAPWPLGLPLAAYLLYRAYQADDVIMAAAATPFLTPYIAPYSIAALMALGGGRYRRELIFVYVAFWTYFVVEARRISLMGL